MAQESGFQARRQSSPSPSACSAVLVILLCLLFVSASLDAQIPSPESILGFPVGADRKLADWDQVLNYFGKVASAAPDRVKFEVIGRSTLGKPFVLLTVSSADNLKHLDGYLAIQKRLADPRGLSTDEAKQLVARGKAVVLVTCTIHSNEVASTQTSMEYVYKLLTEDTPEHREILNNVIFLLIPSLNPDGQDMVVKWYRKYLGTPFEGLEPVDLYQPYTGHDNNRDWYMFTQVESQLTVGKVQNVWHPQVLYDVHQDDPNIARMFVPPFLDPVDPNIDPLIVDETNWLGVSVANRLATQGKDGIVVHAAYDEWSPSRHYSAYHAGIRMLSESASVALASPIDIPFSALNPHLPGYNAQQASWNFPDPWKGGIWRLRDIVDYQLVAFESCLHTVAQNRETFLEDFYQIGKNAVEWHGSPYAYVISPHQRDVPAMIKLLQTLQFGQVEIFRAEAGFTADGNAYPAGSFIIPLAQPYGHWAKTLLERQHYPDLREYPSGPPKRPYDVTAQTLPLLMGVDAVEVKNAFSAKMEKLDRVELQPGTIEPAQNIYLLRADSNNSFRAINRLLKTGVAVERLRETVHDGNREFPPGTFIVHSKNVSGIRDLGLDLFASSTVPTNTPSLHTPRIGLYRSYEPNTDEGWTRWLLEQYEFPYTNLWDRDMRAGNLSARFDVIVLPDQIESAIVDGWPKTTSHPAPPSSPAGVLPYRMIPHPDEFTGGIGSAGVANLKEFVMQGGTLVTLNRASTLPVDKFGLPVRNVLNKLPSEKFYAPGSILRIKLDVNHPLAYGMPKESIAWMERGPAFAVVENTRATKVVASYPSDNPLLSGWLLGASEIQNQSALIDVPLGLGHVVMFGFKPQYRGQTYATFKLFFNALFYFGETADRGNSGSHAGKAR